MSVSFKRYKYLKELKQLHHNNIKFQAPMIIRMFGTLNEVNMRRENRYILCNFLDQHSDQIGLDEDIYETNNQRSLNQLFILAFNKAKEFNLIAALYEEYINSINAIDNKKAI